MDPSFSPKAMNWRTPCSYKAAYLMIGEPMCPKKLSTLFMFPTSSFYVSVYYNNLIKFFFVKLTFLSPRGRHVVVPH